MLSKESEFQPSASQLKVTDYTYQLTYLKSAEKRVLLSHVLLELVQDIYVPDIQNNVQQAELTVTRDYPQRLSHFPDSQNKDLHVPNSHIIYI